jgi:hypothetical protein
MTVAAVPAGTTTTFTIGVNGAWFSSQFNTLFAAKSINDLSDVDTTGSPVANQVLYWNNTTQQWTRSKLNLSQLGDVNITGLANDYILYYDLPTTSFKFKANPATAVSIATCTDVVLTGVANKDVLSWNSGTSKWINLSNTLDNLQNVNTTGKVTNSSIKWNGTNWIPYNAVQNLDDLLDVVITSVANNDRFQYITGTGWENQPLPSFSNLGFTFPSGLFVPSVAGYEDLAGEFDSVTSEVTIRGALYIPASYVGTTVVFTLPVGLYPNTGKNIPFTCIVGNGTVLETIAYGNINPSGVASIIKYVDAVTGILTSGIPGGNLLLTPSIKYYKGI